eukprot:3932553-Rhodomonas_salina.1
MNAQGGSDDDDNDGDDDDDADGLGSASMQIGAGLTQRELQNLGDINYIGRFTQKASFSGTLGLFLAFALPRMIGDST